jgi:hypothetical protein
VGIKTTNAGDRSPDALICKGTNAFLRHFKGDEHEAKRLYRACWSCGAAMGCPQCAGIDEQLMCRSCLVPTEPASMIEVGFIGSETFEAWVKKGARPKYPQRTLDQYPPEFFDLWGRVRPVVEKHGAILPRKIIRQLLDGAI